MINKDNNYTIIWKITFFILFFIPEEDLSDTMMPKDEEQFRMQKQYRDNMRICSQSKGK